MLSQTTRDGTIDLENLVDLTVFGKGIMESGWMSIWWRCFWTGEGRGEDSVRVGVGFDVMRNLT